MNFKVGELNARDTYKLISAVVVPRPIALVTTVAANGVVNAAPFSFFNLLGSDPPMVGISVALRPDGQKKDTLANIEASGEFVVHLVDEKLAEQMNICAIDFPTDESELHFAGLTTRPASVVATPVIEDAPAHLECVIERIVHVGNNNIVLGKIVAFGIRGDVIDQSAYRVDTPSLHLIGRMHGGGWYTRTSDIFNIDRLSYDDWQEQQSGTGAEQ